jgi:uncharacterized protein with PQ loop repeat
MNLLEPAIDFLFGFGLFINALLFIPQIIRLYRIKNSKDLSKITFIGFCFMQLSAILYGYLHHDWVITIGYGLSLITCGWTTILIIRYR